MLDPRTEHATQLRNHWYWRPGHRPGRSFYTWHLTFEGQHDLHRLVAQYQHALRIVPGVDLVPTPWLHITMQGIGFTDEVTEADRDAITNAICHQLAGVPTPALTFQHVTIRSEAIALYPDPADGVTAIRHAIRHAIAGVWGADRVPEPEAGYQPHLSLAYVNTDAAPPLIAEALDHLDLAPALSATPTVAGIAIQRVDHEYRWTRYGATQRAL